MCKELFNDEFMNDMLLNPDLYGLEEDKDNAAEDKKERGNNELYH